MKNIVFLFSLPRSGSTLLQKVLTAHKDIASIAEPWLLLPLVYSLKKEGSSAEYDTKTAHQAITDLIAELPNKEIDYNAAIKSFITELYSKIDTQAELFLDKTPRYYLIIPEIAKIFPEAKFIFLNRNPLSILASHINTWHHRKLTIKKSNIDLYKGPKLLADGIQLLKDQAITIQYENLVTQPEETLKQICSYLDIEYQDNLLAGIKQSQFQGSMGDPNIAHLKSLQTDSLSKWKSTFNSNLRQKYAQQYLDDLGKETITALGYNQTELITDLKKSPTTFNLSSLIKDRFDIQKHKSQ